MRTRKNVQIKLKTNISTYAKKKETATKKEHAARRNKIKKKHY